MDRMPSEKDSAQDSNIRAAFDSMDEAVFIHDAGTGKIIFTNLQASAMYGISPEDFPSYSVSDLSQGEPPYDQASAGQKIQAAASGLTQRFTWHARRKDGALFWVDIRLRAFRNQEQDMIVAVVRDLSHLSGNPDQLQTGDELFRMLFDEMAEGVALHELVFDPQGQAVNYRILDVNSTFQLQTGIAPEYARGKLATEVYQTAEPPYWEIFSRVALTGKSEGFDTYFPPLDRFFSISVTSPRPGFFATIFFDTTEKNKLQMELQKILEFSNDMICVANQDGYFTKINPAWSNCLGWTEEELLARPYIELVHPDDKAQTHEFHLRPDTKGQLTGIHENRYRHKDGTWRWLSWNVHLVDDRFYAVARDITRQKEESKALEALLVKANEHLQSQERLAQLGNLVAGITHEVNTPLGITATAASYQAGIIKELTEAIEQVAQNPSKGFSLQYLREHVQNIAEASQHIMHNAARASDILTSFKQLSVDQTSLQRRNFPLAEVIQQTISSLRPKLKHLPYELEIICPDGINMDSYPGYLSQIITNLVMNSCCHAFEGLQDGTITISASQEEMTGPITLSVSDNGRGISPEILDKIFEPFFTTSRESGGSGLGLSIVRGLVATKLGGTIRVESTVLQDPSAPDRLGGTTFTMIVPNTSPA